MSAVERLASATRTGGAMQGMLNAAERLRRLHAEEQAAFAEYAAARERCASEGVTVDVELPPGMAASFADWKQRRASAAAIELAREDWPRTESRRA
jgi:hypothetical protein